MHDIFANRDHSETFSRSSPMFILLRDLFQSGDEYNCSSLVGGDDYGQPLYCDKLMDHDLAMFMDRGDETSAEWAQITRPKKEREGGR